MSHQLPLCSTRIVRLRTARFRAARSLALGVLGVIAAVPALASAQGTISAQGFGYPPGQISARVAGTAGALAEFDGRSPLNPAALAIGAGRGEVYAQYDPELRSVSGPSGKSRTTTSRFPNVGAIMPIGGKLVFGLSASTLLDRTWANESQREQVIGSDTVISTQTLKSDGGITDLRVGVAYAFTKRVRVGIGGHYLSGSNRVQILQVFPDSLRYGNVSQSSLLEYGGTAWSAGAEVDLPGGLNLAASGRLGREIRMSAGDTLLGKGEVPDHYAVSLGYSGIPGTFAAVRYARDSWTSLAPMSTNGATAVDGSDISVGVESAGPQAGSRAIILRIGARWRDLPFTVSGASVKERSFSGGIGIPVASGDRATIDLAVLRNARSGVSGINENAYNFSFGLRVRP